MQVISFILAGGGISVFASSDGDLQMSLIGIAMVIVGFVLFPLDKSKK